MCILQSHSTYRGGLNKARSMLTVSSAITKQQLNQAVWRAFTKSHGFTLQADAADYLIDRITNSNIPESDLGNALDYIAKNYSAMTKSK